MTKIIRTMILDGKKIANELLDSVKSEILKADLATKNLTLPCLAVILVGDNPASLQYIKMKRKRAEEVGMNFLLKNFEASISEAELLHEIEKLAENPEINGLIVQMPLPKHINEEKIIEKIPAHKDVDGFTTTQIGNVFLGKKWLPSCTPQGIMTLLDAYNIDIKGTKVAILGRSNIVGKPMALMMINAGATVMSCNSHTKNLSEITKMADVVIAAVGKPKFLTREMVSKNAIIIDVGSNMDENGKFCGDADFDNLENFVQAISPSPGGVGPMTVATLIENTWKAYKNQHHFH